MRYGKINFAGTRQSFSFHALIDSRGFVTDVTFAALQVKRNIVYLLQALLQALAVSRFRCSSTDS